MNNTLFLRELLITDKEEVINMREEFKNYKTDMDPFEGIYLFKYYNSYEELLNKIEINKNIYKYKKNLAPQTTYGLFDSNNHIYGMINIRHSLTPSLLKVGGNIAYAIRPNERGKGLGITILKLALNKARELNINLNTPYENRALITCNKDNIASEKTMLKCGAVYDGEEFVEEYKCIEKRYWIDLNNY